MPLTQEGERAYFSQETAAFHNGRLTHCFWRTFSPAAEVDDYLANTLARQQFLTLASGSEEVAWVWLWILMGSHLRASSCSYGCEFSLSMLSHQKQGSNQTLWGILLEFWLIQLTEHCQSWVATNNKFYNTCSFQKDLEISIRQGSGKKCLSAGCMQPPVVPESEKALPGGVTWR